MTKIQRTQKSIARKPLILGHNLTNNTDNKLIMSSKKIRNLRANNEDFQDFGGIPGYFEDFPKEFNIFRNLPGKAS